MGPFKQIKKMFADTRLIATSIVIVAIIMTFISAIVVLSDYYYLIRFWHANLFDLNFLLSPKTLNYYYLYRFIMIFI